MQNRRSDFARQLNSKPLGFLGDPERWGGIDTMQIRWSQREVQEPEIVFSRQLCRGQVEALAAVPWQLLIVANFEQDIKHLGLSDPRVEMFAEINAGVGQTNQRLAWDLRISTLGAIERKGPDVFYPFPDGRWEVPGYACHLAQPLPAAAIAVRVFGWATYLEREGDAPEPLPVRVSATICPVAIPGWEL